MNKLVDFLPPNFKTDHKAVALCHALDKSIDEIIENTPKLLLYHDLENLPETLIDEIAVDLHVDFYDQQLDTQTKQELIRRSPSVHRKKGTKGAVLNLVRVLLADVIIKEWFEYGGDPYMFKVITTDKIKSERAFMNVYNSILAAKNVRSWLYALCVHREHTHNLYFANVAHSSTKKEYCQNFKLPKDGKQNLYLGNVVHSSKKRNMVQDFKPPKDGMQEQYIANVALSHKKRTRYQDFNLPKDGMQEQYIANIAHSSKRRTHYQGFSLPKEEMQELYIGSAVLSHRKLEYTQSVNVMPLNECLINYGVCVYSFRTKIYKVEE